MMEIKKRGKKQEKQPSMSNKDGDKNKEDDKKYKETEGNEKKTAKKGGQKHQALEAIWINLEK